jgi:hypothetical protein
MNIPNGKAGYIAFPPGVLDEIKEMLVNAGAKIKRGPDSQISRAVYEAVLFAFLHGWHYGQPGSPTMSPAEYAAMLQEQDEATALATEKSAWLTGGEQ